MRILMPVLAAYAYANAYAFVRRRPSPLMPMSMPMLTPLLMSLLIALLGHPFDTYGLDTAWTALGHRLAMAQLLKAKQAPQA